MSSGVDTVLEVLEQAGFERLPRPLVVAGSTFDFEAAARGTGVLHDLVVVATSGANPKRLVRLVSGLSRTLDQVASRRPVSCVLVGGKLNRSNIADLEQHARVLLVGASDAAPDLVRQAVAVLMPLELPAETAPGAEPLAAVAKILGASLSEEHRAFFAAAAAGPDAVRNALRQYIDGAARGERGDGLRRG